MAHLYHVTYGRGGSLTFLGGWEQKHMEFAHGHKKCPCVMVVWTKYTCHKLPPAEAETQCVSKG